MNKKTFVIVLLTLASLSVSAAPIDYTVSRTIGAGTVTGSIRTDGAVGTLTAADILSWSLLLNDGVSTFTLSGPLDGNNSEVRLKGLGVSATSSALTFDYGLTGMLLFQAPTMGSSIRFLCRGADGNCNAADGEIVEVNSNFPGQQASRWGSVVFATAGPTGGPNAVPAPETLGLLGLGIVALAATRWRKAA